MTSATVSFWLGAALSLGASVLLVQCLERLGERLGLSEAMLGLVAALAADAPEISSAAAALIRGQPSVGVGVVLGSNVFNLAVLLGLGALVAGRIALHRRVILLEGAVGLWLAAVSVAAVAGLVTPGAGLALALALLIPYVWLSAVPAASRYRIWLPRRWRRWLADAMSEEELELAPAVHPRRGQPRDLAIALAALAVVVTASVAMEHAASVIGARLAMPDIVLGGVVLAGVTSLPNAVAAIYLARRGRGAATLSEAMNSNALNVIGGLLVPGVIIGAVNAGSGALLVAAWYGGLTLCTLTLALLGRGLDRRSGGLIAAAYLIFVTILVTASAHGG